MKRNVRFAFAIALLLAACGGKDTMASKSAAAYRDAVVAKPAPAEVDHSAHAMTPDAHAAHGVATEHAEHGEPAADAHAGHSAAADAHAGMQHDAADAHAGMQHDAADAHAGMKHDAPDAHATMDHSQHGAPDPHAGHGAATPAIGTASVHGAHSKAVALPPHSIPSTNSEMGRVKPADTLKQDAFDAPAPSAVAEAQKKGH